MTPLLLLGGYARFLFCSLSMVESAFVSPGQWSAFCCGRSRHIYRALCTTADRRQALQGAGLAQGPLSDPHHHHHPWTATHPTDPCSVSGLALWAHPRPSEVIHAQRRVYEHAFWMAICEKDRERWIRGAWRASWHNNKLFEGGCGTCRGAGIWPASARGSPPPPPPPPSSIASLRMNLVFGVNWLWNVSLRKPRSDIRE